MVFIKKFTSIKAYTRNVLKKKIAFFDTVLNTLYLISVRKYIFK